MITRILCTLSLVLALGNSYFVSQMLVALSYQNRINNMAREAISDTIGWDARQFDMLTDIFNRLARLETRCAPVPIDTKAQLKADAEGEKMTEEWARKWLTLKSDPKHPLVSFWEAPPLSLSEK